MPCIQLLHCSSFLIFQFLSENGGSSNAFTISEHTNFYFDVKHECLNEGLDR